MFEYFHSLRGKNQTVCWTEYALFVKYIGLMA